MNQGSSFFTLCIIKLKLSLLQKVLKAESIDDFKKTDWNMHLKKHKVDITVLWMQSLVQEVLEMAHFGELGQCVRSSN